ncbi:MAG: hypothetical protein E7013_02945 [Alphaproteobacteria bacterium]|nr:hypothetical protein [Alphaproteobacteria bacterium]
MQKKILFLILICLLPLKVGAQTLSGMTDAQQLGTMAGLALACNAGSRLDDFQLIASYIIANENPTEAKRTKAFKAFAAEKLRTYNMQKDAPKEDCADILNRFYKLPLFNCTIYKNGDVKFPDGKILKAPTQEQKKKAVVAEKKKAKEPKRNYIIPARKGTHY